LIQGTTPERLVGYNTVTTVGRGSGQLEFVYIVGDVFAFEVVVPPLSCARVLIVRTQACSNKVLVNGVEQFGLIQGAFLIFDCATPGVHSFARRNADGA